MTKPYFLSSKTLFFALALTCLFSGIIVAQGGSNECPKIEIISDKGMFFPKQNSTVKAQISGNKPEKPVMTWGTSVGKVVSGNGTSQVQLFFEKAHHGQIVTIFLRVENLPKPCASNFSETFGIEPLLEGDPVDQFEDIEGNSVKARVDNFFIRLNENPNYRGLIEVYFNKSDSNAKRLGSLGKIFRAIRFRNYDASRVDFLVDETPGKTEFVLWLVPPGADLPGDRDKSSLIKGLDVMKDPRKALPKYTCLCK